jgi:hypothetical protein
MLQKVDQNSLSCKNFLNTLDLLFFFVTIYYQDISSGYHESGVSFGTYQLQIICLTSVFSCRNTLICRSFWNHVLCSLFIGVLLNTLLHKYFFLN